MSCICTFKGQHLLLTFMKGFCEQYMALTLEASKLCLNITETRLFRYTEHFNHQKMKIFR